MLAALPAEVRMSPPSTNSTPGSTVTRGCRRASSAHSVQCVVARRPSSSPAAARAKAPVHSDTMRLPRAWACRKAAVIPAGTRVKDTVGSTTTVSALRIRSGPAAGRIRKPLSVVTGPGARPQTNERYQGTLASVAHSSPKTSQATPSSNAVTPSPATMATTWGSRAGPCPEAPRPPGRASAQLAG